MARVVCISKSHTPNFRSIKCLVLRILLDGWDCQVDLHLVVSY